MGLVRTVVGTIGAWIIYALIFVFGRRRAPADVAWAVGPLGGPIIGDRAYEETAALEHLEVTRRSTEGGLIPDFEVLRSPSFDASRVHAKIRDFYEHTPKYSLDTWATTYFPASVALWLLVTTISRRVQQLNFPLEGLDTAYGMTSEIVLLRRADGSIRYTGWFRKLQKTGHVIYTGFYMTERVPLHDGACVKVVFPMPNGNATVVLRPENDDANGFLLVSRGRAFGDVGFYREQRAGDALRIWRVSTLHEVFRLWVDDEGVVRCEHAISFMGLRVLTLHYRIRERATLAAA